MPFIDTAIPDLKIFEPKIFADDRGYFFESYNQMIFRAAGINDSFVQDNQSHSTKGVLRGLHYQTGPYAQSKLVRVIQGEVLDVAVDIREASPHYGKWVSVRLSADNQKQFYVPRGFAHGFVVLSKTATFFYKCDNFYSRVHEGSIIYNDPTLNIDWELPEEELILSEKDQQHPNFGQHRRYY